MNITSGLHRFVANNVLTRAISMHSETSFFLSRLFPDAGKIFAVPDETFRQISYDDRPIYPGGFTIPCDAEPPSLVAIRPSSAPTFSERAVDGQTILKLLHLSFADREGRRPYPSAGRLYSVEVFVCIFAGKELSQLGTGVYHYLPHSSSLELVTSRSPKEMMAVFFHSRSEAALIPDFLLVYQVNFLVSVVKYRLKGYRFSLMEVGSMYQQAEIVGRSLGLGCRVWGGFSDGEVSRMCGTNPTVLGPAVAQLFGYLS